MDLPFNRVSGPAQDKIRKRSDISILFYYDLSYSLKLKGSFGCQVADLSVPFFIFYVSHAPLQEYDNYGKAS